MPSQKSYIGNKCLGFYLDKYGILKYNARLKVMIEKAFCNIPYYFYNLYTT